MDDYQKRKAYRTEQYKRNVVPEGYKRISEMCVCCNGSGYSDRNGSPSCGGCSGKGKNRIVVPIEYVSPYAPATKRVRLKGGGFATIRT